MRDDENLRPVRQSGKATPDRIGGRPSYPSVDLVENQRVFLFPYQRHTRII